ncbi:MAG: DinB family protein [Planctomycetaceae bacterium]|nr:DinB family protein [Planctomycetaceae bacterium]
MSQSIGQTIADSLRLTLGYSERLLKDVTPEMFARFAAPGGQTIASNHAAFVYGHLSLYAPRILGDLGLDAPAIPETFQSVFSKYAQCTDDPDGSLYPAMEDVTTFFFDGYKAALTALANADDAVFQQDNPLGGVMAEKFPTMGSMHNFYVGGHVMIHMGQMSAWRRMQGLGPA